MNTDKKELSEAYKELRKIIGVQDLEKWAADNSKARLEEVKALIKRATQEGQESALSYDDFKEISLIISKALKNYNDENILNELKLRVKKITVKYPLWY